MLFDRENGLLALAPIYLLALSGIGPLVRYQRRTAAVVLSLVGTLMFTVAGHGYESSGTSPLRYIVAIMPLMAVPIAAWVRAIRGRPVALAVAVALTVVSVQMAAAYNLQNNKTITQTIAPGISGWDPSFAFPLLRRTEQPGFDKLSLVAWEIASLFAVGSGFWLAFKRDDRETAVHEPSAATVAASLAMIAVTGCMAV